MTIRATDRYSPINYVKRKFALDQNFRELFPMIDMTKYIEKAVGITIG